jgi:hypothetical protein
MAKVHPEIDERLRAFIDAQKMFFVATAPLEAEGHVNCSPKGLGTFRVFGPTTVAYLDYVASGIETVAHLRQNGRVVIMFCAFEGPPNIVRLHGRGTVVEPSDADFEPLLAAFGPVESLGLRAIVKVEVVRVSDSCGFGVPLYRFEGQRDQLPRWAAHKGATGLETYQRAKNATSIDGLDGLRWTRPKPEP